MRWPIFVRSLYDFFMFYLYFLYENTYLKSFDIRPRHLSLTHVIFPIIIASTFRLGQVELLTPRAAVGDHSLSAP
jgi:hypothetical protein